MELELRLRIVLNAPSAGVDFSLQQSKGSGYQTIQKQRSKGNDLRFDCPVTVKDNRDDGLPNFLGPLTQRPATGRFIYIDIGRLAGQKDSEWERRLKVPLSGITRELIQPVVADPKLILEVHVAGTAKGGAELRNRSSSSGMEMPLINMRAVRATRIEWAHTDRRRRSHDQPATVSLDKRRSRLLGKPTRR